jgi:hypothetical protein
MTFATSISRAALPLLIAGLSAPSNANDLELSASIGMGFMPKGTLTYKGNFPVSPYTTVDNNLNGTWRTGSLNLGYEALRRGQWSFWVHGQFSRSLAQPALHHDGENVNIPSVTKETFDGPATYDATFFGLGVSYRIPIGEIGLIAGPRAQKLSVSGKRQTRVNGTFTYDTVSFSDSSKDTFLLAHITFQQDQGSFRSFERFSYGMGFGESIPSVNPGPTDWKMSSAYLAQFRPNGEFRITLGFRL